MQKIIKEKKEKIMNFKLFRKNRPFYSFVEYEDKNKKEETICVEVVKCFNPHTKEGLPTLWKKNGWTEKELETWWSIHTYVTDKDGNCWEKYNPQLIDYQRYQKGKCVENRYTINFKWIMEATDENLINLLHEVKSMFLECAPTETKIINE